jgi:hypothetical protein
MKCFHMLIITNIYVKGDVEGVDLWGFFLSSQYSRRLQHTHIDDSIGKNYSLLFFVE